MTDENPSAVEKIPFETEEPAERIPFSSEAVKTTVTDGAKDGSVALLAGVAVLVAAVRSVARGRFRAILQLALGAALVKIGLRQRRSATETLDERVLGSELFGDADEEDDAGAESDDTGTKSDDAAEANEKDTSDEAHAAVHDDSSLEPEFDEPSNAKPDDAETHDAETHDAGDTGTEIDAATDVTFTDDESRSKPMEDASHMQADTPNGRDDGGDADSSDGAESDEDTGASNDTGSTGRTGEPTENVDDDR